MAKREVKLDKVSLMMQLKSHPSWQLILNYLEDTKNEIERGILENLNDHTVKYDEDDIRKLHRQLVIDLMEYPDRIIQNAESGEAVEDLDPYPYNKKKEVDN